MHRVLFKIGGITVYSYGVMLLVGLFIAVWYARKRASKFDIDPEKIWDVAIVALIAGVLGARIGFIIQYLPEFLADRSKLFAWRFEGLTSFGGLIGGTLAVLIWARIVKVRTIALLDTIAPTFLVAHAVGRIGCLLNGCCYGGACALPWGIKVLGSDGVHYLPGHYHPAQVYDIFLNLAALAIVVLVEKRSRRPGLITALVLILHGIARFVYEFWRAGTTSDYMGSLPITEAQLAALAVTLAGILVWFFTRKAKPLAEE